MDTTCRNFAQYLGVDLTDGYSGGLRPVDVCGLDRQGSPNEGRLGARFWQWTYGSGGPTNVTALLPEIRAARGTVMDGPQALARRGATTREAEQRLGAPGHTPFALGKLTGPFAGFVRTSVEIFSALDRTGVTVGGLPSLATVTEHYPGGLWGRLVPGMPPKRTAKGIAVRKAVLEALGVDFPAILLTDDHLDACLGALLAASSDGHVLGTVVTRVGTPLFRDPQLREGEILMLEVNEVTRQRIVQAAHPGYTAVPVRSIGANRRFVRITITDKMAIHGTSAIAVSGLSDIGATRDNPRQITIPDFSGHLWLGDHSMFWRSHQTDALSLRTYGALRALLATPGQEEELEVIVT